MKQSGILFLDLFYYMCIFKHRCLNIFHKRSVFIHMHFFHALWSFGIHNRLHSHLREVGCVMNLVFLSIKWLIKDFYPAVTVTIEKYYGGTLICNSK